MLLWFVLLRRVPWYLTFGYLSFVLVLAETTEFFPFIFGINGQFSVGFVKFAVAVF